MPLELQLFACAVMTLTGAAVAFVYDVMRVWREVWRWRGWTAVLLELGTAIVLLGMVVAGWVIAAWGARHVAVLIGFLLGVRLYAAWAGPFVAPLWAGGLLRLRSGCRRLQARLQRVSQRLRAGRTWLQRQVARLSRFGRLWPRFGPPRDKT